MVEASEMVELLKLTADDAAELLSLLETGLAPRPYDVLRRANRMMGAARAFGVEALTTDEGRTIALYVNVGDPYRVTLIYDHENGEYVVGCWADVLEAWEAENPPPGEDDEEGQGEEGEGPDEGDYVTDDFVTFAIHGERRTVRVREGERWEDVIRADMEAREYWPDVWRIDDHGGAERVGAF